MVRLTPFLLIAVTLLAGLVQADPPTTAPVSLLSNPDFRTDDGTGKPADWPIKEGMTWEAEGDARFLRFVAAEPDKMIMAYRALTLPQPLPAGLQVRVRVRTTDVKPGSKPWFDARVMLQFKDAGGKVLKPQPGAPNFKGTTKGGWVEKTVVFPVPETSHLLEVMPCLFNVASGTMDLGLIEVTAVTADKLPPPPPPPPMVPSAPATLPVGGATPPPLKVVGNQLHDSAGKHVWLQGVSIDSLQWSATGEKIQQSVPVAIDQWKANVVRLPIDARFWWGHGQWQGKDREGHNYRAIVDEAIKQCADRGAYLVLDLHRFGAPSDKDIAFWKDAAVRYKNHPAVLFEIFNEPHSLSWKVWRDGGRVGEGAEDKGVIENKEKIDITTTPGMQAIVDAIRATGANNLIIAGGLDWSYNLQGILKGFALDDKGGNGIVYSSHVYPWKKNWQKNFLDVAEIYPLFIGETGNPSSWDDFKFIPEKERYEKVGPGSEWPGDMIAIIQKHKLNWTAFSFHPKCAPAMLKDWTYEPNEHWGALVKRALAGEQFELKRLR